MSGPLAAHQHRVVLAPFSKHHGIALWPPPTNDPKDPLSWPRWLKIAAILGAAMFNFTANFAGASSSVATPLFEREFRQTASKVNTLLTVSIKRLSVRALDSQY